MVIFAANVHPDGSFDLVAGGVSLRGAYPSIDGVPLRVTGVTVTDVGAATTIRYTLPSGEVRLRLIADETGLAIQTRLHGIEAAPHRVEVIAGARAEGVTGIFTQARGMAGGSGYSDLTGGSSFTSWGITALVGRGGKSLMIYTLDHARFEQCTRVHRLADPRDACDVAVGFSTENIPLPDQTLEIPTLCLTAANDLSIGLRHAAEAVATAMNARPTRPASYHWCSWYYAYQNFDMHLLRECLDGLQTLRPERPLDYIQIDAGYAPSNGDWLLPSHRYPQTLRPAFELIRSRGLRPGVWIGPFMAGNRSRLAREHPDWLLRDRDGHRVTPWRHYQENRVWGYPDEETYVLDTSHPAAFDYLRQVLHTLRDWGAEMFKTDFMLWGLHDSTRVRRHTPGKTGVEYFRDVLDMIRREIGPQTFWLGCIAPYMPMVGYADAMRIAGDVGAAWTGEFGPQNMLRETVGSQHFNQVFWQNDPDVLLIRDFHIHLTHDQVHSLALWQSFMGGVVATSDPLHEIAPARRSLWRFVQPARDHTVARLPFPTRHDRPLLALRSLPTGDQLVLAFNTHDRHTLEHIRLGELGIEGRRYAYERNVHGSTRIGPIEDLLISLGPFTSRAFHLSTRDHEPFGPLLLPDFNTRPAADPQHGNSTERH